MRIKGRGRSEDQEGRRRGEGEGFQRIDLGSFGRLASLEFAGRPQAGDPGKSLRSKDKSRSRIPSSSRGPQVFFFFFLLTDQMRLIYVRGAGCKQLFSKPTDLNVNCI